MTKIKLSDTEVRRIKELRERITKQRATIIMEGEIHATGGVMDPRKQIKKDDDAGKGYTKKYRMPKVIKPLKRGRVRK